MIAKNKKIKKDSRAQDIFFSLFIAIIFLAAIGSLIYSNYKINSKRAEMISRIENLKNEIKELEQKNIELQTGISQATSTAYQEEKMREQGYQRPGEQNIVVVPPEEKPENQVQEQKSWWERFLAKINF
jgi:cell division protein FtsB